MKLIMVAMYSLNFPKELYTELIFQGQKGVLEMSIRGYQDVFEVSKDIGFAIKRLTILSFSDLAANN